MQETLPLASCLNVTATGIGALCHARKEIPKSHQRLKEILERER